MPKAAGSSKDVWDQARSILDQAKMMKTSVTARYTTEKNGNITGGATVGFNIGDFKLRASMTDATVNSVVNGDPITSLEGLALAVEKPGSFIIGYDVPKKAYKFQFMNSIRVLEKSLNLNYTHSIKPLDKPKFETILDGTLVFNSANKVSANYLMGSKGCKLKYSYVHGGLITFESSYHTEKNLFEFVVSRKVFGDNMVRATFHTNLADIKNKPLSQTMEQNLDLEWTRKFKQNVSLKVSASLCMAKMLEKKLNVETSWDFNMF